MAAIGISLMAVSCGDKESADTDTEGGDDSKKGGAPASGAKLEEEIVGYWAPDPEAIAAMAKEQIGDDPNAEAMLPMITAMMSKMAIHITPETVAMMGEAKPYKVTKSDAATKTLSVSVTDNGKEDAATIKIDGDKLIMIKDEESLTVSRITEAEFKTRMAAAAKPPEGLALPPGLDIPTAPTPPTSAIPRRKPGTPPPPAPRIPRAPTPPIPTPAPTPPVPAPAPTPPE